MDITDGESRYSTIFLKMQQIYILTWYQTNRECRCSLKPTLGSEHAIDAITILLSNCMNSDDVHRNVKWIKKYDC